MGATPDVLRRNLNVTLPPHERLRLLSAPIPVVPPEELQDTVRPNAGVVAPVGSGHDDLSVEEAITPQRERRKERLRAIVIGCVLVAGIFAAIVLWVHQSGRGAEMSQPDEGADRHSARVDPAPSTPAEPIAAASPRVEVPSTVPVQPTAKAEESARPPRAEPKPTKPSVPVEPRRAGSPHATQLATAQAPPPSTPAPKPSSSRIVPADD